MRSRPVKQAIEYHLCRRGVEIRECPQALGLTSLGQNQPLKLLRGKEALVDVKTRTLRSWRRKACKCVPAVQVRAIAW